jgi:hypothetical protein
LLLEGRLVILDRVAAVTRDPALADQAARYKAGL